MNRIKCEFPGISDDLVNSYHLLLSCVDYINANALKGSNEISMKIRNQGRIQEFKKGGAKLDRPPYRAVANRISKVSEKKGLFVRKKRLELV